MTIPNCTHLTFAFSKRHKHPRKIARLSERQHRVSCSGMKMTEITDPLKEGLSEAYGNIQESVADSSRKIAHTTDEWVHDNPWKVIAIVAVTSLVLGVLLGRRGSDD